MNAKDFERVEKVCAEEKGSVPLWCRNFEQDHEYRKASQNNGGCICAVAEPLKSVAYRGSFAL